MNITKIKFSYNINYDINYCKDKIENLFSECHCKIVKDIDNTIKVTTPFPAWGICDYRLYEYNFPPFNPFIFTGDFQITFLTMDTNSSKILVEMDLIRTFIWELLFGVIIFTLYSLHHGEIHSLYTRLIYCLLGIFLFLFPLFMIYKAIKRIKIVLGVLSKN